MSICVDIVGNGDLDTAVAKRMQRLQEAGLSCCSDLTTVTTQAKAAPGMADKLAQFRALADESRLLIVAMLRRAEALCGCEIQTALEISHATVSHHMSILADAGLVERTKKGLWVFYRLSPLGTRLAP